MAEPLRRLIASLAAAEMVFVMLAAPALIFPSPGRLIVALLIPLAWLCHWLAHGRAIPATPLNAALSLLLLMTVVSLAATFDIRVSLGKVCGVFLGIASFWASARWIASRERLRLAVGVFVLAGAGLATIGLLGTNWFEKFPLLAAVVTRLPRTIRGIPGAEEGFHPNAVAGCLVLFVPLQAALTLAAARRELPAWRQARGGAFWSPALMVPALLVLIGTLALTQSRGAWAGTAVALLVLLVFRGGAARLMAAGVLAGVLATATVIGWETSLNLAISQSGPGMAGNVGSRIALWSKALQAIADFPVTGMGMNVFRSALPALYPGALASPDYDVAHAHNHFLQAALDLGIPGLIAYASIWLTIAALLVAIRRRAVTPIDRMLGDGLTGGLVAHFCFSMTDAIPLGAKVGLLFWLTLALVVALHQVSLPAATATASSPPDSRRRGTS